MQKTANRQQLAKYGHQGHLGGWITSFLAGKQIKSVVNRDDWLVMVCTDGHEARIGWQSSSGNKLSGKPFIFEAQWTDILGGQIDQMLMDGVWLIMQFTNKPEARIGWVDEQHGNINGDS